MEAASIIQSNGDVRARLSYAQKRDLVSQAFAAVVTTALIAAPLIGPSPGSSGDVASEGTLPAQSFARVVTAVAVAGPSASSVRPDRPRAARAKLRTVSGRLQATPVSTIAMQPAFVAASADLRATSERAGSRKPLSRKLTGWLTGDGTVSVRPFPTVAAVRQ
jgi:hypothetical protein